MRKRKVLMVVLPYLVQPDAQGAKIRSYLAFPYGVMSIAKYCEDVGEFRVLDLNGESDCGDALVEAMNDFDPEIVGFSMMFDNSYKHLGKLAHIVKDFYSHPLVVLGGAAASYSYEEILAEQPFIDGICFGEGEIAMRAIIAHPMPKAIMELHESWYTRKSGKAPALTLVQDINPLIDIDYSLIDMGKYAMAEAFSPYASLTPRKQFYIMTSRGCPFGCLFCSNSKIHGKKVRMADVDVLMDHIWRLKNEFGMEVLTIYDDQLLLDLPRAKKFFRRMAEVKVRIEMPNGLSVRYIDQELAILMRDAGVDTVYLAIESGSEKVLHDIIKKPLELSQVKPAVEALRNVGMFIHGFFVMGMPGETYDDMIDSFAFMKKIDLDWYGLNMATPVRGSRLYDDCIRNGWIEKKKIQDIVDKEYVITANGDPKEITKLVDQMNIDINFLNNRRMRIGDYATAKRCFEQVLARYPGHFLAQVMRNSADINAMIKEGKNG